MVKTKVRKKEFFGLWPEVDPFAGNSPENSRRSYPVLGYLSFSALQFCDGTIPLGQPYQKRGSL